MCSTIIFSACPLLSDHVLLNTVGLWLMYFEIPTLPQLPPSATLLKALWPRLQKYSITSSHDVLYSTCEAGATGDEGKAKECMDGWTARVPGYTAQVDAIRKQLWETFPNEKGASLVTSRRVPRATRYCRVILLRGTWHAMSHPAASRATSVSREGKLTGSVLLFVIGAVWLVGWH